jgi:hypothetical protein
METTLLRDTTALLALRGVFFFACRHYVSLSLNSGLRSVIEERDGTGEEGGRGENELNDDSLSFGGSGIDLDVMERGAGGSYKDVVTTSTPPGDGVKVRTSCSTSQDEISLGTSAASSPALSKFAMQPQTMGNVPGMSARRVTLTKSPTSTLYSKLATSVFCVSFSESCMLFTLVLFGEAVSDR